MRTTLTLDDDVAVLRPFSPGRCLVNELDDVAGVLAVVEGDDFR